MGIIQGKREDLLAINLCVYNTPHCRLEALVGVARLIGSYWTAPQWTRSWDGEKARTGRWQQKLTEELGLKLQGALSMWFRSFFWNFELLAFPAVTVAKAHTSSAVCATGAVTA